MLVNLFMHYAFDSWMAREFPAVTFERYSDDIVVHCVTERQAREVWAAIDQRMAEVGLRLHPAKTRVVYCKDSRRRRDFGHVSFTFLGYTFQPRGARDKKGEMFTSFLPAMSRDALKDKSRTIRSWRLHLHTGTTLEQLADLINPVVRGWMNYYGRFYRSEMDMLLQRINTYLVRWARRKYRRLHAFKRLKAWWDGLGRREPGLFAHWQWTRGFEWIR